MGTVLAMHFESLYLGSLINFGLIFAEFGNLRIVHELGAIIATTDIPKKNPMAIL